MIVSHTNIKDFTMNTNSQKQYRPCWGVTRVELYAPMEIQENKTKKIERKQNATLQSRKRCLVSRTGVDPLYVTLYVTPGVNKSICVYRGLVVSLKNKMTNIKATDAYRRGRSSTAEGRSSANL